MKRVGSPILALCLAACGVRPPPPPPPAPPALSRAPLVELLPLPGGGFSRWRLRNRSASPIRPPGWPGFVVRLERRAPGGWEPAPIGRCETVQGDLDPLAAGGERGVATLPPMGPEILTPGSYRAAVEYVGARGDKALAAASFSIVGLGRAESDAFVDALSSPPVQRCLDHATLAGEVDRFVHTADPAVVPRLLDVPAARYPDRLVLDRSVAVLPDAGVLLLAVQATRTGDAAVSAGVALTTTPGICWPSDAPCRAMVSRWTAQIAAGDPLRPEILDALAARPDRWPPDLPAALVARIPGARDPASLASLATTIAEMPDEALPRAGEAAVQALRRAANGAGDAKVRATILHAADSLAKRLHPGPDDAMGDPGEPLTAEGDQGGGTGPCTPVVARLDAMLRIRRPEDLRMVPDDPRR